MATFSAVQLKRRKVGLALAVCAQILCRAGWTIQEIYYWDSYFTMLGLAGGRWIRWRIWWRTLVAEGDAWGCFPNGRTYYLESFAAAFLCVYG